MFEQAWFLATTLQVAILKHLSEGHSSSRSPTVGNMPKTAVNCLWAIFKTHQLMKEFTSHGFKDHPCLTGKIGCFMIQNMNFAGVFKLENTVTSLQGVLSSLKTKTDGMKKMVDQHTRDITKLKAKVK
jgi:hypothetical protein